MPALTYRPFGETFVDLSIDFRTQRPLETVTDLLKHCTVTEQDRLLDEAFFWGLPVGERMAGLLKIWAASGAATLDIQMTCTVPTCEEQMESSLDVAALLNAQAEVSDLDTIHLTMEDRTLAFRKPTGADQQKWSADVLEKHEAAFQIMLADLFTGDETPVTEHQVLLESKEDLEIAFKAADPLVDITFEVQCPACSVTIPCTVDLQSLLLQQFERIQRRVLFAVHTLALHYHWTEQEIFTLPAWRRAHYLDLIQSEGAL